MAKSAHKCAEALLAYAVILRKRSAYVCRGSTAASTDIALCLILSYGAADGHR